MSKLIVVCGLGGTGKTTLANALSKELNIACIHKDSIKSILYDKGIVTEKTFPLFKAFVEEQLNNNVDLIIEATFEFAGDDELLKNWQTRYGLELICVICETDYDERIKRIHSRVRHESHLEADAKHLENSDLATFDYSIMPGKHISIITTESPDKCLQSVVTQLHSLQTA